MASRLQSCNFDFKSQKSKAHSDNFNKFFEYSQKYESYSSKLRDGSLVFIIILRFTRHWNTCDVSHECGVSHICAACGVYLTCWTWGVYQSVPLYRWVTLHIIKVYCDGNCWEDFKKQETNSCHITVTVNLNPCDRSCIFGLNIQKLKVYLGSFNKIFRITRNISAIYKEHSFKSFLTYAFS